MKLSDYREGRPKRAFLLTPSRHLGINKRRSMDAREGGIEHLRREEPESINSFVIDATSSVRKTMESRSRFSNWSITLVQQPSMNCIPFECQRLYYISFPQKKNPSSYIRGRGRNFLNNLKSRPRSNSLHAPEYSSFPKLSRLVAHLSTWCAPGVRSPPATRPVKRAKTWSSYHFVGEWAAS